MKKVRELTPRQYWILKQLEFKTKTLSEIFDLESKLLKVHIAEALTVLLEKGYIKVLIKVSCSIFSITEKGLEAKENHYWNHVHEDESD